jgi:hypothetical protein
MHGSEGRGRRRRRPLTRHRQQRASGSIFHAHVVVEEVPLILPKTAAVCKRAAALE